MEEQMCIRDSFYGSQLYTIEHRKLVHVLCTLGFFSEAGADLEDLDWLIGNSLEFSHHYVEIRCQHRSKTSLLVQPENLL